MKEIFSLINNGTLNVGNIYNVQLDPRDSYSDKKEQVEKKAFICINNSSHPVFKDTEGNIYKFYVMSKVKPIKEKSNG